MAFVRNLSAAAFVLALAAPVPALDRPEVTFPVFQFPADRIPRIDGDTSDWSIVPEAYVIGMDQMIDADHKHPHPDPANLDIKVRVGWVEGLNRLYVLYEAQDDYWDFAESGHRNDTFELIVDGDASGGPLVDHSQRGVWTAEQVGERRVQPDPRIDPREARWSFHGVHAQNYHIFTPARNKDWAMVWGSATWIKNLPYANAAIRHAGEPGQGGPLTLEFWITPFDYAGPEGPARAVESTLSENKIIGLGWIVIDYDEIGSRRNNGFWTLSRHRSSFGDASLLPAFRLMPIEPHLRAPLGAAWSFTVANEATRTVAFRDRSWGEVTAWRWDFGDGATSTQQHPVHHYTRPGNYVVVLEVTGPRGTARHAKVWDVQFR